MRKAIFLYSLLVLAACRYSKNNHFHHLNSKTQNIKILKKNIHTFEHHFLHPTI